jgi:alpha-L-fucosidase
MLLAVTAVSAQRIPLDSLQRRFVDKRFGMFIHFNMNTYSPGWANAPVNPLLFNPTNLDCAQWAAAAKAAKMTFGMLTAKHHDGFRIWPSTVAAPNGYAPNGKLYTIAQSSQPTMDVVKSYTDAFRAAGLWPGLYMSMFDVANDVPRSSTTRWTPAIRAFVLGQITELLTNYGEIPIFWFDGYAWASGHWANPWQEVRDTIKKLQPNCIIVETNGMQLPWESDAVFIEEDGTMWCPPGNTNAAVSGSMIAGDWFWNSSATSGSSLKSVDWIVNSHLKALEPLYCNVLLDCPPNRQGLLDTAIVNRLTAVGAAWSPNLSRAPLPKQPLMIEHPITPLSATATSGTALNAIDGVLDRPVIGLQTLWQSTGALPQSVTLDFGKSYDNVEYLFYLPRRFANTTGNITSYKIYTSIDGTAFTQVTTGANVTGGSVFGTWAPDSTIKRVIFAPQTARYLRLEATAVNGGTSAVICDLSVGQELSTGTVTYPAVKTGAFHAAAEQLTVTTGRVVFDGAMAKEVKSITVFDMAGHLVRQAVVKNGTIDLNREYGLTQGVFIVRVNTVR